MKIPKTTFTSAFSPKSQIPSSYTKLDLSPPKKPTDPEILVDFYLQKLYSTSPKQRVEWLFNLSELHLKEGDKIEAAVCKVCIAAIMVTYLKSTSQLRNVPPYIEQLFESIAPIIRIMDFMKMSDFNSSTTEQWIYSQLLDSLKEAYTLFKESKSFELSHQVYELIEILDRTEKSDKNRFNPNDLFTSDIQTNTNRLRLYYRIIYYGKKWPIHLRNKKFIYVKSQARTADISSQLIEKYIPKYDKDIIVMLPHRDNFKDLEELEKSLDPEKVYILMVIVEPEETNSLHNDKFFFEGYIHPGSINDLKNSIKTRTIYKLKYTFPHLQNRIEIESTEQIILSPIENAIELITEKSSLIQKELESKPTQIKKLQQVIMGCSHFMTNTTVYINKDFLSDQEISLHRTEHVSALITAEEDLLNKLGIAIKLNESLIETNQIDFSKQISESYKELENTFKGDIERVRKLVL